jgi:[phosphatase 2A protein]-leucine-carboxy methyltransferase
MRAENRAKIWCPAQPSPTFSWNPIVMLPPSRAQAGDTPIRSTDNDAAVARLSAVQKQYLEDPFIKYLVPRAHLQPPRPPLINIGTYVRSSTIDVLVDQWLELSAVGGQRCQIVSLGSGSDTRFWRIAARRVHAFLQDRPFMVVHR